MLDRVLPRLKELLLGFFDVIPEPLLTIFDFQELELLMCGLPEIDMADWMEHTEYSAEYDDIGGDHQSCKWFWEVLSEFDHDNEGPSVAVCNWNCWCPQSRLWRLAG
jgi:E3 ubiquitin-protein ligase NEDD4